MNSITGVLNDTKIARCKWCLNDSPWRRGCYTVWDNHELFIINQLWDTENEYLEAIESNYFIRLQIINRINYFCQIINLLYTKGMQNFAYKPDWPDIIRWSIIFFSNKSISDDITLIDRSLFFLCHRYLFAYELFNESLIEYLVIKQWFC